MAIMIFTAEVVRKLTGILVDEAYDYKLVQLSLGMVKHSFTKKHLKMYWEVNKVKEMIERLEMGGTLPAIILYPNMRLADGCHRMAAYTKCNTKSFYGLIKRLKKLE